MPDNKNNNKPKENSPKKRTIDLIPIGSVADNTMDIIRHIESTDRSGVRNETEAGAYGYYQFIISTQKGINDKYKVNLTHNSREEQHEAMRLYMLEHKQVLNSNNIPETPLNYYLLHFGGPSQGLKIIQQYQKNPNAPVTSIFGSKALEQNKSLMYDKKGKPVSVSQFVNVFDKKIKKGETLVKKESPQRKAELAKEKTGIYENRRTPVSLTPGSFDINGKNTWHKNLAYPNGTDLSSSRMDFVLEAGENGKKVIKKGTSQPIDVSKDYKTEGYDMSRIYEYDPNDLKATTPSPEYKGSNQDVYDLNGEHRSGRIGYTGDFQPDFIKNQRVQPYREEPGYNEEQMMNAAAVYNNPKNPNSSAGNLQHLVQIGPDGKPLVLNSPENRMMNPDTSMNPANLFEVMSQVYGQNPALEPVSQSNFAPGQQFKEGGNLNNMKKSIEESNSGLISFNEGGTHEQNPNGGIPQNQNPDGSVNLVEEGETKHGEYVFSNNLKVTEDIVKQMRLPEEIVGKTFAEASKYLNDVLEEHPGDIIIRRTVESQLESLKRANDLERGTKERNDELLREIDEDLVNNAYEKEAEKHQQKVNENVQRDSQNLTPEQQMAMQQQIAQQQGQVPQNPQMQNPQSQMQLDPSMMNMFDLGGWLDENSNELNTGLNAVVGATSGIMGMEDMFDPTNEADIKSGKTALGYGALGLKTGADIGSAFGLPGKVIGGAIGAIGGGVTGLIRGEKARDKQIQIKEKNHANQLKGYDSQFMDFRNTNGIAEWKDGGYIGNNPEDYIDENGINQLFNYNSNIELNDGGYLDNDINKLNDLNSKSFKNRNMFNPYQPNIIPTVPNLDNTNYLSFGNQKINSKLYSPNPFDNSGEGEVLENMVIDVPRSTNTTTQSQESATTQPSTQTSTEAPANSGYDPKVEAAPDENFIMKGQNFLKYVPALGAYLNNNEAKSKMVDREVYRASGRMMDQRNLDFDTLLNELRLNANNTNDILVRNSNGNAATARANILASQNKINQAAGESFFKTKEYLDTINANAHDKNNVILQHRDAIHNQEVIANMQNKAALEAEKQSMQDKLYTTLGSLGKELDLNNIAYNLSRGYDKYGRKNHSTVNQVKELFGNRNNNSQTNNQNQGDVNFNVTKQNEDYINDLVSRLNSINSNGGNNPFTDEQMKMLEFYMKRGMFTPN